MNPVLKAPGSMLMKLENDRPLSNCAFDLNLRRYNTVIEWSEGYIAQLRVLYTKRRGRNPKH